MFLISLILNTVVFIFSQGQPSINKAFIMIQKLQQYITEWSILEWQTSQSLEIKNWSVLLVCLPGPSLENLIDSR